MPIIRKAVFPVAGMGTRFLPATKASPKEMLPVVDKPLVQYAVEEALSAGVTELIFITGRGKRAIEDHFDKAYELEAELEKQGRSETLKAVKNILPKNVSCIYIRQPAALGLGHAVLCAQPAVGDEPFAVILADDLIDTQPPALKQMVQLHEKHGASVIAVQKIARKDSSKYGVVRVHRDANHLYKLSGIVEKPQPDKAPSNLAVIGRYILTAGIFNCLKQVKPGASGEIQLTDGIALLLKKQRTLAYEVTGKRYDCGSKLGYLKATVELATKHPEVGRAFRRYLSGLRA